MLAHQRLEHVPARLGGPPGGRARCDPQRPAKVEPVPPALGRQAYGRDQRTPRAHREVDVGGGHRHRPAEATDHGGRLRRLGGEVGQQGHRTAPCDMPEQPDHRHLLRHDLVSGASPFAGEDRGQERVLEVLGHDHDGVAVEPQASGQPLEVAEMRGHENGAFGGRLLDGRQVVGGEGPPTARLGLVLAQARGPEHLEEGPGEAPVVGRHQPFAGRLVHCGTVHDAEVFQGRAAAAPVQVAAQPPQRVGGGAHRGQRAGTDQGAQADHREPFQAVAQAAPTRVRVARKLGRPEIFAFHRQGFGVMLES